MHKITEIRFEGFYLEEYEALLPHSELTIELLERACGLVDETIFWLCDGIVFDHNIPYAELIDFEGGLTYKEVI